MSINLLINIYFCFICRQDINVTIINTFYRVINAYMSEVPIVETML